MIGLPESAHSLATTEAWKGAVGLQRCVMRPGLPTCISLWPHAGSGDAQHTAETPHVLPGPSCDQQLTGGSPHAGQSGYSCKAKFG